MKISHPPEAGNRPSLPASLEMISNLIYLAKRPETLSNKGIEQLDKAATIVSELQHHPKLSDGRLLRRAAFTWSSMDDYEIVVS